MTPSSIGALLAETVARGLERLEAQRLLAHVLNRPRSWLLAHDDEVVDIVSQTRFEGLVTRRLDDEPFAYLFGDEPFDGLAFDVSPAVLVPRADTEVLVDWAVECVAAHRVAGRAFDVVDLGTGSGAIAVSIAMRAGDIAMTATDVSADALAVARANASRHGIDITWHCGSWWTAIAAGRFDLAVSNPPYLAADDRHLAALRHEPALALVSGADGLDALREIVGQAPRHLRDGAWLLVEHGFEQAADVRSLFAAAGFAQVQTRRDRQNHERCTGGRAPPEG